MNGSKANKNFVTNLSITFIVIFIIVALSNNNSVGNFFSNNDSDLRILSSYENQAAEKDIINYVKKQGEKVEFTYMGDLDIVEELNNNSEEYDAVWISNSMWLYMLNNSYLTSNSKSISVSPVVFGIKESKAKELGLVEKEVTNNTILNLIKDKKIKYLMPSVTQTNTGATAYLGFLASLAGNPEVLTEEMLENDSLINDLKNVFSGVERVSGDEDYLEEMFINGTDYEAVIAAESSLININKTLKEQNKEQLYLIYPTDGVALNDSTFAFINNDSNKEETFLTIQKYLLSEDGQKMLEKQGQRTWYGGTNSNSDKEIFNPSWGIDTTKYLNVTRFPSKNVITAAINLYIESLRKPAHVVFCLDFSGSMEGDGDEELKNAMSYILDYEKAKKDKLQFSKYDKITVIPFSTKVREVLKSEGRNTNNLMNSINENSPSGKTALYEAIEEGLSILSNESDDYTKTIIAMTDGEANIGTFQELEYIYNRLNSKVPIYSITFGYADESQLEEIAKLSNAKVFDGKTSLLRAFKEVRGYN